jgi:hypothetical protein
MAKTQSTLDPAAPKKPSLTAPQKRLRGFLRGIRTMANAIDPMATDNTVVLGALKGMIDAAEKAARAVNGQPSTHTP